MRSLQVAQKRARILSDFRVFFTEQGFLEVDTPSLVRLPGMEPYLNVFKTRFEPMRGQGIDLYLITSPEYAMKRLLADGYEKIFQITKSFRNKETGGNLHNPEFTMLEWYRCHANYVDIMDDLEKLIQFLVPEGKLAYRDLSVDVTYFERLKVVDAFQKYAGISQKIFENIDLFRAEAQKRGYSVDAQTSYDDIFFLVFLNEIEPNLGIKNPTILYEYPASMAALSKLSAENPQYAERFELYIAGMELANAFSELNDASEQRKRLQEEREQRRKLGKMDYEIDEKFLEAVGRMPPSGGIALGVDRLIMLLTGSESIEEVIFFPFSEL